MITVLPYGELMLWLVLSGFLIVVLLIVAKLASILAFHRAQRWLATDPSIDDSVMSWRIAVGTGPDSEKLR